MQTRWNPKLLIGTLLWVIAMAGFAILWARGDTSYAWQNGIKSYASTRGSAYVNDLQMLSPSEGWAAGRAYNRDNNPFGLLSFNIGSEFGVVLHYTGDQWQPVTIPNSPPLNRIFMVSPSEGWAVGGGVLGGGATILHCSSGSWSKVTAIQGLNYTNQVSFNDVYMLSATDGWMVGGRSLSDLSTTLIMHYSGGQWQAVDAPSVGALNAVAMISPNEGWAIGSGVILHYLSGKWQQVAAPQFFAEQTSLHMVSPNEGWVAAGYNNVLRYIDGQWKKVGISSQLEVQDLSMVSANSGWAVGDSNTSDRILAGAVVRYDGQSWQLVDAPNVEWLRHVYAVSANEAWMADESGTIYHYLNGDWSISYSH